MKRDSTSITNRIAGNQFLDAYPETIPPGESASIPIIFSVSRPCRIDVRALLVAAASTSPDELASTTLAQTINCQPLISLRTATQHSRRRLGEYLVDVEISNNANTAVQLDSMAIVSPFWDATLPHISETTLLPNQTCRNLLQVKPAATAAFDLRQQALVDNLGKLVDNQPESITSTSHPDIPATLDPSLLETFTSSRVAHKMSILSEQFPPISPDIARSIFPLLDPLDLDLIISWSIPETQRTGHYFLHGLRLSPEFSQVEDLRRKIEKALLGGGKQTRTMYEETGRLRKLLLHSVLDGVLAKEDDPIVVRGFVVGANAGIAEFDLKEGPCLVPATIEIHNLSPLLATRYILRLPPTFNPTSRENYTPARHVGTLEHRGSLKPGETVSISTSFWIQDPALVELEWELVVETGEEVDGVWTVRKSWTRREQGGVWKIEQTSPLKSVTSP